MIKRQLKLQTSSAQKRGAILIYDKILEKKFSARLSRFPRRYAVKSGEALKDLAQFPSHMTQILKLAGGVSKADLHIVAVGGGSVGDFAGFVASVLRRGVPIVQVPTTWLAAVDSAHGGKTALNVQGFKNQIGTFWPASECLLVQDLLFSQPPERLHDSYSEILKIALIQGGSLWKEVSQSAPSEKFVWKVLPKLIAAKDKVVAKDPFEKKGLREILNLGHTMGHVFEKELKCSHGEAVMLGLRFAVDFSVSKGLAGKGAWQMALKAHPLWPETPGYLRQLKSLKKWQSALSRDKKSAGKNQVRFIFVKSPGRVLVQKVSVAEIGKEIQRQLQISIG